MTLRTALQVLRDERWKSPVGIAIPVTSELTFSFPSYFLGWFAGKFPDRAAAQVEEVDHSSYRFDEVSDSELQYKTFYFVDGCELATMQDFANQYERQTNCLPGSDEELIVVVLTTMREQAVQMMDVD